MSRANVTNVAVPKTLYMIMARMGMVAPLPAYLTVVDQKTGRKVYQEVRV